MEKKSEELAGEDLAREHLVRKAMEDATGVKTKPSESAFLVARNVLREELGEFGPYNGTHYKLTEGERDILLAHSRQDAGAAAAAAGRALDTLLNIERSLRSIRLLLWMILLAIGIVVLAVV